VPIAGDYGGLCSHNGGHDHDQYPVRRGIGNRIGATQASENTPQAKFAVLPRLSQQWEKGQELRAVK
jgi:hypothetical protein